MPDDEELEKVKQKAAQAESGGDSGNGKKEKKEKRELGAEAEKKEKPIDVLKRQLEQEKQQWAAVAEKVAALGETDGKLCDTVYYHKHLRRAEAEIDEQASPEALNRQIEMTQYRVVDLVGAGRLYMKQADELLIKLKAVSFSSDGAREGEIVKDVDRIVADLNSVISQAEASFDRAGTVLQWIHWLKEEYKQRLVQREGYDSPKDLDAKNYQIHQKRWKLAGERLGKWRHKAEISQLEEEYRQGQRLLAKLWITEPIKLDVVEAEMKSLLQKIYEAAKTVVNACHNSFHLYDATHPIGNSRKSITEIEDVFMDIPEPSRQAYREIFRLMPNGEEMEQRFEIERDFKKIWEQFQPAMDKVKHGKHDANLSDAGSFHMWESGNIRGYAKAVTVEEWQKLIQDRRVQDYASPEQIRIWERKMAEVAQEEFVVSHINHTYDDDKRKTYLDKMIAWGGAETAPLVMQEARKTVDSEYSHNDRRQLIKYAERFSEDDLVVLRRESLCTAKAIELLKHNSFDACFNEQTKNPEYIQLTEQIKKDPEVIQAVHNLFNADQLTALHLGANGQISGIYQGHGEKLYHILSVLNVPEQQGSYEKGTSEFGRLLATLTQGHLRNCEFSQGMLDGGKQIEMQTAMGSGWKIYMTPKKTAEMAVKFGHAEELWNQITIKNPIRQEILDNIDQAAMNMFVRGDNEAKRYVLQKFINIKGPIDFTPIIQWLESQEISKMDRKFSETVPLLAVARAKTGDKQLAWAYIKKWASIFEGNAAVGQGPLTECFAAWVGKEMTDEEAKTMGKLYGMEPVELRKFKLFVEEWTSKHNGRYQESQFADYKNLWQIPNLDDLTDKLKVFGYGQINLKDAGVLAELSPVISEVVVDLQMLQVSGIAVTFKSLSEWKEWWELSKDSNQVAEIVELTKHGYQFYLSHRQAFPEMVKRKAYIIMSLEDIRQVAPNYVYQPLNNWNTGWKVDPYEVLFEYNMSGIRKVMFTQAAERLAGEPGITNENWQDALFLYVCKEGEMAELPDNTKELADKFFSADEGKQLCLNQLRNDYRAFVNSLGSERLPAKTNLLVKTIEEAGGAGHLKYVELLGEFISELYRQNDQGELSEELRGQLLKGLADREQGFDKGRWNEESRSMFYGMSRDILKASPIIYNEMLKVCGQLSAKEFAAFVQEQLPLYQAQFALAQKDSERDIYETSSLLSIQKKLEEFSQILKGEESSESRLGLFQNLRAELVKGIQERFKDRFGILKVPEQWDDEKIRFVQNFVRYMGNIKNRDESKERLIACFLALNLHGQWQKFRQGENVDLSQYFEGEQFVFLQKYLEERVKAGILTAENLGLESKDLERMQKIFQEESIDQMIGNVETIDVKLGNLARNLEELGDEDAYPGEREKKLLGLCKQYGKDVGGCLSKTFGRLTGKALEYSERELSVLAELEKINSGALSLEAVQALQNEVKPLSLVANTIGLIKKDNVGEEISKLQACLQPSADVVAIFSKIGENFQPQSGALALSQDLSYLENIIVKNQESLTKPEQEVLQKYLGQIRGQMQVLETINAKFTEQLSKISKSAQGGKNEILKERAREIEKLVSAKVSETAIVSKMTNNFNLVIENMRQCLGCMKKEANNDTNLSFGDSNKFYLLSQSPGEKGSIADEIAFVCPVTLPDGQRTVAMVLDQVYGNKSADILLSHIKVAKKKFDQLKKAFPEMKLVMVVPDSTMSSSGLNQNLLKTRLAAIEVAPEQAISMENITVTIPKSAGGDHYVEFGGGLARQIGDRQTNGLVIR